MKIKIISLDNLTGQEIDIKNILAIRFVIDNKYENWIDAIPTTTGSLSVRGMHPISIQPESANTILIENIYHED